MRTTEQSADCPAVFDRENLRARARQFSGKYKRTWKNGMLEGKARALATETARPFLIDRIKFGWPADAGYLGERYRLKY